MSAPGSWSFAEPERDDAAPCSAAHRLHRARSPSFAPSSVCTSRCRSYSGGLGMLAGDLLKEASDLALPMVGVGLMYRTGYFHQRIDTTGYQHEYWIDTDPERLPAAGHRRPDGRPAHVTVPVFDIDLVAAGVAGRRRPRAAVPARHRSAPTTHRSAAGSRHGSTTATALIRLAQYAVLGVGGVPRAARAWASQPTRVPPQRGPPGAWPCASCWPQLAAGRERRRGLGRGARADRVHHPHPGPRRQRDLRPRARSQRVLGASPISPVARARCSPLGASIRTSPAQPSGLTPLAMRASRSRERREPSSRRGGASDVAAVVAGSCDRRGPDHARHERRARPDLARRGRCASCSTSTSGRTGCSGPTTRRRGRRSTTSPTPSCGARATRAARRLVEHVRMRRHARSAPPRRVRRLRRGRRARASTRTCSRSASPAGIASYKRLHLLVARPGPRRCALLDGARPCSSFLAGKAHPMDDGRQAHPAATCSA